MLQSTFTTTLLATALLFALSCNSEEEEPVDTNCEAVADHIEELCGPVAGEREAEHVRQIQCEALGGATVDPEMAACTLGVKTCSDLREEDDCDVIAHVTLACAEQSDCPEELHCDTEASECVRCRNDDDCDESEACSEGICLDRDSLAYKQGPEHVAECMKSCADPDLMDCSSEVSTCASMCAGTWDYLCETEQHALAECVDAAEGTRECDAGALGADSVCRDQAEAYLNCMSEETESR